VIDLAEALPAQPEKLDHEPLLFFSLFSTLTSDDPLQIFHVDFSAVGENREIMNR
jgi:hypothetical protein